MAIIKKYSSYQNLTNFNVLVDDGNPNSDYFRITEFKETFTGGKNGFLIEGSPFLKETTEVKIEVLDVNGNPIYYEPGKGTPDYYEGISTLVSVHVYDDTPIGLGKITILGELKQYVDDSGVTRDVPDDWRGIYNVKWERTFQINKNLNNEDIVRFYKRPQIQITELVKPIFSKTIPTVTDTVDVTGVPENPPLDTDLTNWRAGTNYKLIRATGSWDRDVDENTITISSLNYSPTIIEVLNDREVLVDVPYTENNLVKSFISQSASVTYSDFQNEIIGESALTGSFAKIDMSQLKTFVGDVARVKIFRKSRNTAGDFQFVQESKLESTELLRDVTTQTDNEISYGNFTETNLSNYWVTSSTAHPTTIDSSVLSQAVKVDYNGSGVQKLITSESFTLSKDVEYTLSFRTLLSGSTTSDKYVKAYFSGSYTNNLSQPAAYTQSFMHISGSGIYTSRQRVSQNILAERDIDAKLVFEFYGDDWYISNVSLRNAQETSFSPDEFTLIQDIPRKLAIETFDFRFEFYDINNNYIPVDVVASSTFTGGNDYPTSGKLLTFESDRNAFRFSTGSIANPYNQTIQFKTTAQNLTGSILFESQAFDVDGNYLSPSNYSQYPGLLTNVTTAGALLTLSNFTGSYTGGGDAPYVGSVVYTASLENLQEFETVYRLEDGDNAPSLLVTSNANQFIYEPTALEPKPSGQSITVRAQRKNLASLITPLTINSGSNLPPLNYVSTINGVDTYTISALQFSESFAQNNFDEVTYSFTGSDVFGNEQSDEMTLSKVINFDGVSVVLSTENTSFNADSTGFVTSTEFDKGDGTVDVRVGSKVIVHDDAGGGTAKNTFDIVSVTPSTGLTPNSTSPTTNSYGISAMTADSGTLTLLVRYKAGDNSTTVDFTKVVNYSKSKIAAPVLSIETTNKDQSVSAFSTGEQVDSFSNSVVSVKEQYGGSTNTLSLTGLTATRNDTSGNVNITTPNEIELSAETLADGTNNTTVSIAATVTDSEGTSRTLTDTISLSKVKKAQPSITFSATPQAQTIDAKSTGVLIGTIQDVTIGGFEGNTALTYNQVATLGVSQYKITNVTGVTVSDTTPSTSTIDVTSFSGDTAIGTASISYVDSEGTSGTSTIKFTISKAKASPPVVLITATPQSQNVSADSSGVQTGTLSNVVVSVENGTFVNMTKTQSGFSTNPTISSNILTMTSAIMNAAEASVTLTVNYNDSEGTAGSQEIIVRTTKTNAGVKGDDGAIGQDGKRTATGLVHYQLASTTAPATPSATSYNFSNGTFSGLTANWALGAPTYASGNTNKYWFSTYSVVETTAGGGTGVPTFGSVTQAIGFSGLVSFTANETIGDGTNNLSFGLAGTTLINGDNISTGRIISTNWNGPDSGEVYADAGMEIDLDDGKITAKNFRITSDGSAYFRGNIEVGSSVPNTVVTGLGDLATRDDITLSYVTNAGSLAGLNSVSSAEIDNNAVTNTKIISNAITEAKIAANAITEGKISANAVVADKIAANAITADKILAGAIVADKIAANAITANKIAANAVTASKILANTIDATKISSLSFSGKTATFDQGSVGGFTLKSSALYTGTKSTLASNVAGVYVGTDGIAIGTNSPFKVTSAGILSATNANISGDLSAGLVAISSNNITLGADTGYSTVANINFQDPSDDTFCQFFAYSGTYGSGLRIADAGSSDGLGNIRMDTQNIFMMPESTTFTVNKGNLLGGTFAQRWKDVGFEATDDILLGLGGQGTTADTFIHMIRNAAVGYHTINMTSEGYLNLSAEETARIDTNGGSITLYPGSTSNYIFLSGNVSKSGGSFQIDHPIPEMKDTHWLVHSFVESPQANNIYRGRVTLENGTATINLDTESNMTEGTWVLLNRDPHVYTSNESDWDNVRGSVEGNILTIECQNPNSTASVTWMVLGERHDEWMMNTVMTDEDGKVIVELEKNEENSPTPKKDNPINNRPKDKDVSL